MSSENRWGSTLTDLDRPAVSLNAQRLVDAVCDGFSAKIRATIPRATVEAAVAELELDDTRSVRKASSLRVRRLRFSGVKTLRDQPPEPFVYDQAFAPGVNVICVPANEVGKSSVLKTIMYALTGDAGDFDPDVRSWITDVWLAFSLDKQEFTILLSTGGETPRAVLVAGEAFGAIEEVATETTLALFDVRGTEAIKTNLQRFFFERLQLGALSWTQQDASVPGGIAQRSTSWLTYSQALQIADAGYNYLLCDPQHAIGNQEGLIFSAFLGLHLVEPLNQLGQKASVARREIKVRKERSAADIAKAEEEIRQIVVDLEGRQKDLADIDSVLAARRASLEGGEPTKRLMAVQSALVQLSSEHARLGVEREELNRTIQQQRGRERQLREAVALHLHFTGLEVSLCPNCDATVEMGAIERERTDRMCRLCGRPAHAPDTTETAELAAKADVVKAEIDRMVEGREAISGRLTEVQRDIDSSRTDLVSLQAAGNQGIVYALPTAEEESQRSSLQQDIGRLRAELTLARKRAEPLTGSEDTEAANHIRVVEKLREMLSREAADRNHDILERLSSLTQQMAQAIGAESISDVTCSPLGRVDLQKHGKRVSFNGIQNEGERLRIKLAFFVAMMRLGREPGLGRHPGFLLVDQPGSGEMVREDFEALAGIFRRLDEDLAEDVQMICCTAREEFGEATDVTKVYGAQNHPYVF